MLPEEGRDAPGEALDSVVEVSTGGSIREGAEVVAELASVEAGFPEETDGAITEDSGIESLVDEIASEVLSEDSDSASLEEESGSESSGGDPSGEGGRVPSRLKSLDEGLVFGSTYFILRGNTVSLNVASRVMMRRSVSRS